jgi:hypothetical protein
MASPFKPWWVSYDLGKYRPCDATYCVYPYKGIPPLDAAALDGTFRYLSAKPVKPAAWAVKAVAALDKKVQAVGRVLPPAFRELMSRPKLYASIPSCTACEWDLGAEPIPNAAETGAYTIRFLRDQQDLFLWYLYLSPSGGSEVICSRIPFDDPGVRVRTDITKAVVVGNTCTAAPDFESFVYRYWMENELWNKVNAAEATFTPAQQAYLDHYTKARKPKARRKPAPARKKKTPRKSRLH